MRGVFTGFDSAWGAGNTGAICDLVLKEDGELLLQEDQPIAANWDQAVDHAGRFPDATIHIWAIDQPICVVNESGCRPVEADLARALMAGFGCGAHSSNLSNPCWGWGARIWNLLRELAANGYRHNPMAVPQAKDGQYFFECYLHPAIVGLFDLDRILKYKVRHRDAPAWQQLLGLL
jgi:predicted RNase H-like nuclease